MITIWRLTTRKTITEALDGEGAKRHGGRWNSKGTPCVYASGSPSLALLESLVHFDLDTAPSLYLFSAQVDDNHISPTPKLPVGWQDNEQATQEIGRDWITSGTSLLLEIPSAIVPMEKNYLINPTHEAFGSLEVIEHGQFDMDRRLLR